VHFTRSDVTLDRNTVASNSAHFDGGGLYLNEAPATIEWNTITGNTAGDGGGLYLWFSEASLNGNTVVSNAADKGGGLFLAGRDAEATNTLIADNQGHVRGSGLHATSSSFHFLHTTIALNSGGDGSGIYVGGDQFWGYGALTLTNTILVSHTMGIYVRDSSTATLDSTLWHGNTTDWSDTGTTIHTHDFTGDPGFVGPALGDYHIRPSSAALDAGISSSTTGDIDREPRPMLGGFDLGADELPPAPVASFTAWPTSGIAPLAVEFTDTSSSYYTEILWDFGDTGTSDQGSPTHIYPVPGTYAVSLWVSGYGGEDSETKAAYIAARHGLYLPIVARAQ
jgi:hypothetical protein